MISCLIGLIITAIIVLIVLWLVETLIKAFGVSIPPPILMLLRVLAAVIVLLYVLQCLGITGDLGPPLWSHRVRP